VKGDEVLGMGVRTGFFPFFLYSNPHTPYSFNGG